ncbi:MAG TPA: hypothetical protein VGV89_03720 [Thermoplasmata archaeon]|nr:hypothetical protein [Thermoplasmata archaeon]
MESNELSRRLADYYLVANETLRDVQELTDQQVKHWIVAPFLVALGWDPSDKKQVYLDYPVSKTEHADYALLDAHGQPRVLVDVRRPGVSATDPEDAGKMAQTVKAPLLLITNGQEFSLWHLSGTEAPTPLTVLTLKDLPENSEALIGLSADYRGSDTGIQLLRRVAIRQAVLQLLEENSERTFEALAGWVRNQVAPNGGLDDLSEQAVREATLMWLSDEHLALPAFTTPTDRVKHSDLRITSVKDWEQFPRGPMGTFQYRFDTAKTLDVRQNAKEVREALRNQGLRTGTATAFGGFYSSLRNRAGLPAAPG